MGGNALSVSSVRLAKAEFEVVAATCEAKLRLRYPDGRVNAIKAYRSKKSHGDLDLLVTAPDYDPIEAAKALNAVEVVRNGPVTSVGINVETPEGAPAVFQVDLIFIKPAAFDYAYNYFAFNDLGNLIGRTAHAAGIAHRHDGLWFYVRDGDYKFREILLTQDYEEALSFLGYDVECFRKGFETLEDLFWFVANSKYFNADIYLLENRNAKSRIRDRKRKTYCEFLVFCEQHPDLPKFTYPENKFEWLGALFSQFPRFKLEFAQAMNDLAEQRILKKRFNGAWVAQLTGLEGKELGALMKRFKESFESDVAMKEFLLAEDSDVVAARVLQEYETQNLGKSN